MNRLLDDPTTSSDLRMLLDAGCSEQPSTAAIERMAARLGISNGPSGGPESGSSGGDAAPGAVQSGEGAGVGGAGAGAAGAGAAGGAAGAGAAGAAGALSAGSGRGGGRMLMVAGISAAVTVVALSVWTLRSGGGERTNATPAVVATSPQLGDPADAPAPAPVAAPARASAPAPAAAPVGAHFRSSAAVGSIPSERPSERVGAHKGQASDRPTASGPSGPSEVQLIDRARRAVAATRFSVALAATASHRDTFPRGALSEERDALEIEALLGAGQHQRASRRLDDFVKAFPRSSYRAHLERLLASPDASGTPP